MALPFSRLRRWFALGAILMIATVAGMYFYTRWRVHKVVHDIPAKIGLDIQQTAEGFSISKSEEGRTLFTVSASKAVQFKGGGRAELHSVKIVIRTRRLRRKRKTRFILKPTGWSSIRTRGTLPPPAR
jgi:lipopolysaccharide export system protein LptA